MFQKDVEGSEDEEECHDNSLGYTLYHPPVPQYIEDHVHFVVDIAVGASQQGGIQFHVRFRCLPKGHVGWKVDGRSAYGGGRLVGTKRLQ